MKDASNPQDETKVGGDTCDAFIYDAEKVEKLQARLAETDGLSPLFKVLSDTTRLKVAYVLSLEKELCVCDIATAVGASVATVSHHLRLLRGMDLATFRKEGKMAFYSLKSLHLNHLIQEAIRIKEGRGENEPCTDCTRREK